MPYGSPWSETFVCQLTDKEVRDEFVADQIRTRIALLVRALREQPERHWSQTELGKKMGKPQNVVSRLEDPDYGKMNLQTLLEAAAAFDLPLWIDMPEWEDWLTKIRDVPKTGFKRNSFDAGKLVNHVNEIRQVTSNVDVTRIGSYVETKSSSVARSPGSTLHLEFA
ncbi:MAG: helix-turn-helix domain-containing protein [Methylocella sp.]